MHYIDSTNISRLRSVIKQDLLIVPIMSDPNLHHTLNRVSLLYMYDLKTKEEYIINGHNNDLVKFNLKSISKATEVGQHFVYQQETVRGILPKSFDLELYYWYVTNDGLTFKDPEQYNFYRSKFRLVNNINDSIPVSLHIKYCRIIRDKYLGVYGQVDIDNFKLYSASVFNVFKELEYNVIPVNKSLLEAKYKTDRLFAHYKLYTATGRPSNAFNGINLAAINKDDGSRGMIRAAEGYKLIEFDFDAYHLRLIANLIDYQLPNGNLHQYFGRKYFKTPFLSEEQYNKSKVISFQLLYGKINEEYRSIEFFDKIYTYRQDLHKKFTRNGFVETPIYKRKIFKDNFDSMPPNKLFNYILQAYETENNSIVLKKLSDYLYKHKSEFVLFTYDSFLIHCKNTEGKMIINGVLDILNQDNLTSSIKYGNNYHDMKRFVWKN